MTQDDLEKIHKEITVPQLLAQIQTEDNPEDKKEE
jgi:hypothetical protein